MYKYKKKRIDISFEVVELVGDHEDSNDEWIDRLERFSKNLDHRAEFEMLGTREYGEPIIGKLKSSPATMEVTDIGYLHEDESNSDELWEKFGSDGWYFWFNGFDPFMDEAEKVIEEIFEVDIREYI